MSDHDVRTIILSTDDLDESIRLYTETLGTTKFRDGSHFAALDGGSVTIALATAIDHPMPGKGRRRHQDLRRRCGRQGR